MKMLFKFLLWILLGVSATQGMSNGEEEIVSPWQSAEQSTQYGSLTADRGVDGNPQSCSHTETQTDPWWKLELLHYFQVNTVAITNLNTIFHTRFYGAVLRVGNFPYDVYSNSICAEIPNLGSGATANFSCGGMEGRYVIIHIPGNDKILNVCEAVVYGYMPENAALWRYTVQSTWIADWYARNAVDGLTQTCSQTTEQTDPWWRLNLLNEYRVNQVVITNIVGSYHSRINGAVIRIGNVPEDVYSNSVCAEIPSLASGATAEFNCSGMEGRYVFIHNPGFRKILFLCEVDVFGDLIGNRAKGGAAIQSSTSGDWSAERAIDGDRGFQRFNKGCSSTLNEANPWLRVDLHTLYSVSRVAITNRNDNNSKEIVGMQVRIGDSLENNGNNNPICAVSFIIPKGESYNYTCNGMVGRYVNLIIPGHLKTLTLCEVEVFGKGPILGISFVRMQFSSGADLTDQRMSENVLQQLGSALADRGFTNMTLKWSEKPKQVVQKLETAQSCNKEP